MALNLLPLVASDFSGLGQLQAGRDAREQAAQQFAQQLALSRQAQQQRAMEVAAARQQQQRQFAESLALQQDYRATHAAQVDAARELQALQFEQSRQDVLRQDAAIGADRAVSRADRAGELRDQQDLQERLGMSRINDQRDTLRRAQSDQSYRMLLGVAGSDPGFDLETLNQRAGPDITLPQWEQVAHTGASREQQEAETRKASEQAAAMLNNRWKTQLAVNKVKPKEQAASWDSFLRLPANQPLLKLVAPNESDFSFSPFGREPGTSFRDWRTAAYNDSIAADPPQSLPPAGGGVGGAGGGAPAGLPAALPRLGRSALHTAIGGMAELNEAAIRNIARDLLQGRITPAEAQQRRAQIVASMGGVAPVAPVPMTGQALGLGVPVAPDFRLSDWLPR